MRLQWIGLVLALALAPKLEAQKTLGDTDPLALYNRGFELYSQKQYAAAQLMMRQYVLTGPSRPMRAEAEYYIASSALELYNQDAEALLYGFSKEYPEHPKARLVNYALGRFYFREKNYEQASEALAKVDESELGKADAGEYNFMVGYVAFKNEDMARAKSAFGKVSGTDHANAGLATYYLGYIAYEEAKYDMAMQYFSQLKGDSRFDKSIPQYIIQINLLQGKYDEVIAQGEEFLTDKATSADLNLYVAEAYFRKRNYGKAVEFYDAAQNAGVSLGDHHLYQYGYALQAGGNSADALKAYSLINVADDSLGQNVTYNMGLALQKNGEMLKARNAFSHASKLSFDKRVQELAQLDYAKASYVLKQQRDAIDGLRVFLKQYPQSKMNGEARELLGAMLAETNNPKEAIEIIEGLASRSAKLDEAYQRSLYQYGIELFTDKKYGEAEDYFTKSLNISGTKRIKALAYFWQGECRYVLGKTEAAQESYKNFLYVSEARETPFFNVANYNIGYCAFKRANSTTMREDYASANTYFKKYISNEDTRNARYNDAVLRSADCEFMLKNYAQSLSLYTSVIDRGVAEGDYATYQKGTIEGLQRRPDDKIATMRNLTKKYPSSNYVDDALFEIADEYFQAGNYKQALEEYQALNRNYPKNPYYRAAQLSIGLVYYNTQKDNAALQVFKGILKQYPYSAEAREALIVLRNIYVERGQVDSFELFARSLPDVKLNVSAQDSINYSSAFSFVKRNDCPGTVRAMEGYLSKFPNGYFYNDAHFHAAQCAINGKDTAKALTHYNAVINRSPNEYVERSLKATAALYYLRREYAIAANRYTQLEDLSTTNPDVLNALLGQLRSYARLKQNDKTIGASQRILSLGFASDEQKNEARFHGGMAAYSNGDNESAVLQLKEVARTDKSAMGAEALYTLALVNYNNEKLEDAQKQILQLSDKYAYYDYWVAKGFILLSDVFVAMGDTFQAKSTLQSIIDNYEGEELKTIAKEKLRKINQNNPKGGN